MVASAFVIAWLSESFGLDPVVSTPLVAILAAICGALFYRFYHAAFERRGDEAIQGIAFFFGLMFLVETGCC